MNSNPGNAEPQLGTAPFDGTNPLGTAHPAKTWYSRGYLPHCDQMRLLQSITFRLADSLPQEKLQQLEEELKSMERKTELELGVPRQGRIRGNSRPKSFNIEVEKRKHLEHWLDAGMGCCVLRHPQMAQVTQETLLTFDDEKYRLLAWFIMPNHVHVLIESKIPVSKIVQSWKSYTGRWAMKHNAELELGVPRKHFWMREYWDRYIRNENHFHSTVAYIHNNPVKARFCMCTHEWPWSSAAKHLQRCGRSNLRADSIVKDQIF